MSRRIARSRIYNVSRVGKATTMAEGSGAPTCTHSVFREGHKIITEVVVDLAGTGRSVVSKNTAGDIIGVSATSGAHIGQLTTAQNGYITDIEMVCLEVPTTGDDDIMLYAANASTGSYDEPIAEMSNTKLIDPNSAWSLGEIDGWINSVARSTASGTILGWKTCTSILFLMVTQPELMTPASLSLL